MRQKKSSSILKKFLLFNLGVFSVLGLFTIVYLKAIQPNLVKKRANNHTIIINNTVDHLQRLNIKLIDLGEVGDWGRPINYNNSDIFYNYTDWIWKLPQIPDTVLIDGRFRVCCFLTSLKNAKQGTKIIFDDYCNRPYYHIVENYIQREVTYGRQCLFIVPSQKNINFSELDKDIKNFRFVMD